MSQDFLCLLSSQTLFPPLLFSSSVHLIDERPPLSSHSANMWVAESDDYHGAVLDGAVWLDAWNCGIIKHWHWGFHRGLSNSLTFSAAKKEKQNLFLLDWYEGGSCGHDFQWSTGVDLKQVKESDIKLWMFCQKDCDEQPVMWTLHCRKKKGWTQWRTDKKCRSNKKI